MVSLLSSVMEKYTKPIVLSIVDYEPSEGIIIHGVSETVPNESLSLHELVRKSQFMASLPDLAKRMQDGPDEDFDDDLPTEVELDEVYENSSYLAKYSEKLSQLKQRPPKKAETKVSEEEVSSES